MFDCQGCHGASLLPNTLKKFFDTAGGLLWTASAHGKVHSLSKSSWLVQPITEQSY